MQVEWVVTSVSLKIKKNLKRKNWVDKKYFLIKDIHLFFIYDISK